MLCQVSWQLVSMKSQSLVHGLGEEADVAAEVPVGTTSAAHASTAQEARAAARIIEARMPSFVKLRRKSLPNRIRCRSAPLDLGRVRPSAKPAEPPSKTRTPSCQFRTLWTEVDGGYALCR